MSQLTLAASPLRHWWIAQPKHALPLTIFFIGERAAVAAYSFQYRRSDCSDWALRRSDRRSWAPALPLIGPRNLPSFLVRYALSRLSCVVRDMQELCLPTDDTARGRLAVDHHAPCSQLIDDEAFLDHAAILEAGSRSSTSKARSQEVSGAVRS